MRYPVYFCGSISMEDLARALSTVGFHIRVENGARVVADPIPKFLRPNVEAVAAPVARPKLKAAK